MTIIPSWTPGKNRVMVLAIHESRMPRASGLIIPSGTQFENRWFGLVVANNSACELEFGDLVELGRWQGGNSLQRGNRGWLNKPLETFAGVAGGETFGYWRSKDGTRQIEVTGRDRAAILAPEQILYRIASWRDLAAGKPVDSAHVQPIGNRVLVIHHAPPETSESGIALVDWHRGASACGTVAAVGALVKDIKPGDWVIVRPGKGALLTYEHCKAQVVPENAIEAIIDDPADPARIEWTRLAEVG